MPQLVNVKGLIVDSISTKYNVTEIAEFKDLDFSMKLQSYILELADSVCVLC